MQQSRDKRVGLGKLAKLVEGRAERVCKGIQEFKEKDRIAKWIQSEFEGDLYGFWGLEMR